MRTGVTPPGRLQPADPTWCPTARRKPCPLFVRRAPLRVVLAAARRGLPVRPDHRAGSRRRLPLLGLLPAHRRRLDLRAEGPGPDGPQGRQRRRLALRRRRRAVDPLPARRPDLRPGLRRDPRRRRARSASVSSSTSAARRMPPTARPRRSRRPCAPSSPTDATSSAVLATAGDVRTEKGLVCGVAGYPTSDCGGAVKEVSPEAKAADQPVTIAAPASGHPSASATTPAATGTDVAAAQTLGHLGWDRGGIRHRGPRPARPHRLPARALAFARPAGRPEEPRRP